MGTTVVYQIKDAIGSVLATFFSRCSHRSESAESHFRSIASRTAEPNELVEALLAARYETSDGKHHAGDRVFNITSSHDVMMNDRDAVVIAQQAESVNEPLAWKISKRVV